MQDKPPSRTSTVAVNVVDTCTTKGEVMAARLRIHSPSRCNSTARVPDACLPQPEEAAMPEHAAAPEQAAAIHPANSVSANEPETRAEAASSDAEPAELKRSQSLPPLSKDERKEQEEQKKAAQRSTRSDHEVQYLNERDIEWQKLLHGEADTAEAEPVHAAVGMHMEQKPGTREQQQQLEAGQQSPRPLACSAEVAQSAAEAAGVVAAPMEENDAALPAATEAHAEAPGLQGSSAADCGAAYVRQLLHKKLAAKGKLHLKPLARGWAMGKNESSNKIWFEPPGIRTVYSCPQAILVLEKLYAENAVKSGGT